MQQFVANALIAVGWLILSLAGLCTGTVVLIGLPMLLSSGASFGTVLDAAGVPLVVGGTPIAIGLIMIWGGRRLGRTGAVTPQPNESEPEA
jgi:hypothetical protein